MEGSRNLKYNVGGQWETSVHPVAAFVPSHLSLVLERTALQACRISYRNECG